MLTTGVAPALPRAAAVTSAAVAAPGTIPKAIAPTHNRAPARQAIPVLSSWLIPMS